MLGDMQRTKQILKYTGDLRERSQDGTQKYFLSSLNEIAIWRFNH